MHAPFTRGAGAIRLAMLLAALLAGPAAAQLTVWHDGFPTPYLPPVHPNPIVAYYGHGEVMYYPQNNVSMTDPVLRTFTNINRTQVGANQYQNFNAILDVIAYFGGNPLPVSLTGTVTTIAYNYTGGQLGTFNTAMVSMDMSANTPYGTMMLRESPTLASTGQTGIAVGNNYQIASFFDVFTQLSVDSGFSWYADTYAPTRLTLCPEPGAIMLLGLSGVLLIRRRR